jgi:hypothetical protein
MFTLHNLYLSKNSTFFAVFIFIFAITFHFRIRFWHTKDDKRWHLILELSRKIEFDYYWYNLLAVEQVLSQHSKRWNNHIFHIFFYKNLVSREHSINVNATPIYQKKITSNCIFGTFFKNKTKSFLYLLWTQRCWLFCIQSKADRLK